MAPKGVPLCWHTNYSFWMASFLLRECTRQQSEVNVGLLIREEGGRWLESRLNRYFCLQPACIATVGRVVRSLVAGIMGVYCIRVLSLGSSHKKRPDVCPTSKCNFVPKLFRRAATSIALHRQVDLDSHLLDLVLLLL